MLAGTVKIVLPLQLLLSVFADVEKIYVGNGQLVSRRDFSQGAQLDSKDKQAKRQGWLNAGLPYESLLTKYWGLLSVNISVPWMMSQVKGLILLQQHASCTIVFLKN